MRRHSDNAGEDSLSRDLARVPRKESGRPESRREALALLKARLDGAKADIRRNFETGTVDGLSAARMLSGSHDTIVRDLCSLARIGTERIAVVATGGYGRGELAPGSDIDLLFLSPARRARETESAIEFIVQWLWDLGLKVGHAARSADECIRRAGENITVRTSLLDARRIAGDRALYEELRKRFRSQARTRGAGSKFVSLKLAERDERHFRQGESRYLVEPNVKDGKGGLRDLQTLYWIGKYLYGASDPAELVKHGAFTGPEFERFHKAEAFLWSVRFHLHYLAGRAEERLSFDLQPELARRMGHGGNDPRRAVEAFMRRYFLTAREAGDLTRIFCAALEQQNVKPKPSLLRLFPGFLKGRGVAAEFFVENGRLNARTGAFRRDPVNVIRIFRLADAKGAEVHPAALRTITRSLEAINGDLRQNPEANRLFLEVLLSRNDPERALRLMNEAGVLGRFVPEFGRVVGQMQFNMYHHYTVDEHLIRAAGNLAAMERGDAGEEHRFAADAARRVESRTALHCAVLLHDIAKGARGDHSEEGAAMALRLCPRLGLSPEQTADAAWLVKNHLAMSDTAQRRDVSDPKTVRDFVDAVQTPERLRQLLALTVADIRAVGPGVWNGWKARLLRDLYCEAEALMAGGDSPSRRPSRVAEAKAALEGKIADWSAAERERALGRYNDAYWLAFGGGEHLAHANLMRAADRKGEAFALVAECDSSRSVSDIAICTHDRPGLFSQLAGAISISGGSIVEARAFTTADGRALDVFSVQDAEGGAFGDAARIQRLRDTIGKILAGGPAPGPAVSRRGRKKRQAAFEVRPHVRLDNGASAISTVLEIEGADRPGLLHDLAHALFESGLSISSAIAATYGERAVDVFYVRDAGGRKLAHAERIAAVEAALNRALEAPK